MIPEESFDCESAARKIRPVLQKDQRIIAAYLMGSIVSGRLHDDSDIDIAILPDAPKTFDTMDRLYLSAAIQDELTLEADIGILSTHDLVYATQAIVYGKCIFVRDKFKKDLFAATCLSLYAQFKFESIEVENAYRIR